MNDDVTRLADSIFEAAKSWFGSELDLRLREIRRSIDKEFRDIDAAFRELPAPKDGEPGRDGKDGLDGKDFDPATLDLRLAETIPPRVETIRLELKARIDDWLQSLVLPKDGVDGISGKDGKDGRDGIDGKDGAAGLNGKDFDPDLISERVSATLPPLVETVHLAMKARIDGWLAELPLPLDGKDGKDGRDGADGVDGARGESGERGEPGARGVDGEAGQDGKDFDPELISARVAEALPPLVERSHSALEERVDSWLKALPIPIDGKDGKDGRDGIDGKDGPAGTDGIGVRGEKGDPGVAGERGEPGLHGKDGRDGVDGKDGADAIGEPGEKGDPGEPGKDGRDGVDGVDGKDGAAGIGERGDKGDPGESGKDGRDGVDGINGKDGADAIGERGEKGDPGDRGSDGRDGVDGINGKDGVDAIGERGEKGERGDPGADGKDGADGVDGLRGKDGVDGRDGLEGKAGEPGRDALQIEILPAIDEARSYPRNTYASHKGGVWVSRSTTRGMLGWECVWRGLDLIEFEESDDGRTITEKHVLSDGTTYTRTKTTPTMIYRGIWKEGAYRPGDTLTWQGSLWHCDAATTDKPGDLNSKGWCLAAKRGRDGKDGIRGERGERGDVGRPGRDLTQVDWSGKKT